MFSMHTCNLLRFCFFLAHSPSLPLFLNLLCTVLFMCAVVLSVPFSFLRTLSLSFQSQFPSLSLSPQFFLCLSPFLKTGFSCATWWVSLSFFLPVSHSPFLFLARSFPHSATGPLTLLFSPPTPTPLSLFLSLPCDCAGPQRPAQIRVIYNSILTDRELGLEFVATLQCNMPFLRGSSSFSLAFFPSESHFWMRACSSLVLTLSLQLLVVLFIV